jgi:exopolysaccharide production protein ExoZ
VIYNLQSLRALAAFVVIFVHMDLFAAPLGLPRQMLAFGNSGVDIFFVLSGFLMVHTSQLKPPGAVEFAVHRIVRVVPLYWIVTFAVFGVALFAPALLGATRANWDELAKSLAFIPFRKSNSLIMPVLFVGWTLNYEMAFYLIFALMLGLTKARIRLTALLSIALIALLVLVGVIWRPATLELRFYTNQLMLEFAFGMAVALWFGRERATAPMVAFPLLVVALLALFAGAVWLEGWPRAIVSGLPATIVLICAISLDRSGWHLRNRGIALLGNASFALYLTHAFSLQGIGKLVPPNAPIWLVLALLAFAVALAHAVAIAIHIGIEKPMTRQLRNWLGSSAAGR